MINNDDNNDINNGRYDNINKLKMLLETFLFI